MPKFPKVTVALIICNLLVVVTWFYQVFRHSNSPSTIAESSKPVSTSQPQDVVTTLPPTTTMTTTHSTLVLTDVNFDSEFHSSTHATSINSHSTAPRSLEPEDVSYQGLPAGE